jgi:hypothetical protein
MSFFLDHIIIAVRDLERAMQHYREHDFTVNYGGEHASGTTHNALIVFKDGTYFELMALTGKESASEDAADYSNLIRGKTGIVGYAVASRDLQQDLNDMRQRGVDLPEPQYGSRLRADGVKLEWITAMDPHHISPFFIEDRTPREHRIPREETPMTHANGVQGIGGLLFNSPAAWQMATYYEKLLGIDADPADKNAILFLEHIPLYIRTVPARDTAPIVVPPSRVDLVTAASRYVGREIHTENGRLIIRLIGFNDTGTM